MALTDLALKRLSKKAKLYEVQDHGGLFVRVWGQMGVTRTTWTVG